MTASDQLSAFAATHEPRCKSANTDFICLTAEHLYLGGGLLRISPCLFLSQVSGELACGHLAPTDSGRQIFIRVRTPFVVSSTLRFVTLRTYSLIIAEHRGRNFYRFHRLPPDEIPPPDLWDFLTEAATELLRSSAGENLFIQFEEAVPIKPSPNKPEAELILAYRLTFSTGTLFADASSPASPGITPAAGGDPVHFYML